jgi:NTE family protein
VLDRLLEEERIEIDAVSGASAGAMNAVVLADGLAAGGRGGAREALRAFWGRVSRAAALHTGAAALFGDAASVGSPLQWTMDWMARFFAPQQYNPLDINPPRRAGRIGRLRAGARAPCAAPVRVGHPRRHRPVA